MARRQKLPRRITTLADDSSAFGPVPVAVPIKWDQIPDITETRPFSIHSASALTKSLKYLNDRASPRRACQGFELCASLDGLDRALSLNLLDGAGEVSAPADLITQRMLRVAHLVMLGSPRLGGPEPHCAAPSPHCGPHVLSGLAQSVALKLAPATSYRNTTHRSRFETGTMADNMCWNGCGVRPRYYWVRPTALAGPSFILIDVPKGRWQMAPLTTPAHSAA
jgi:hypothetical protein